MADLEAGGTASVPDAEVTPAPAAHSLTSGDIPADAADADAQSAAAVSESSSSPHTPKSSPSRIVMKTVRTVLPKAEPLPWCTFISLSVKVAIP